MASIWFLLNAIAYTITGVVISALFQTYRRSGMQAALTQILTALRASIPGLNLLISFVIQREAHGAAEKLMGGPEAQVYSKVKSAERTVLPEMGVPHEELIKELEKLKSNDADAEKGRLFAYVYTTEKDKHLKAVREAYHMFGDRYGIPSESMDELIKRANDIFSHENGLNPAAFPSLRKFETETCSMIASMLNGDENVVGNLTSGGTESILMTIKTYRDLAREKRPHITDPEIVGLSVFSYNHVMFLYAPVNPFYCIC